MPNTCAYCGTPVADGTYDYNIESWYHPWCYRIVNAHDSLDAFQQIVSKGAEHDKFKEQDNEAAIAAIIRHAARAATRIGVKLSDIADEAALEELLPLDTL